MKFILLLLDFIIKLVGMHQRYIVLNTGVYDLIISIFLETYHGLLKAFNYFSAIITTFNNIISFIFFFLVLTFVKPWSSSFLICVRQYLYYHQVSVTVIGDQTYNQRCFWVFWPKSAIFRQRIGPKLSTTTHHNFFITLSSLCNLPFKSSCTYKLMSLYGLFERKVKETW